MTRRPRSAAAEEHRRERHLRAATPAGRLRTARRICGAFLLFPLVFVAIALAYIGRLGASAASAVEVGLAALTGVLALGLLASAPSLRGRMARVAIEQRRAGAVAYASDSALYAAFATASIAGFLNVELASMLGFMGSVLAHSMLPVGAVAVLSYAIWAFLWPREATWRRWAARAVAEGGEDG